jgi:hypothetical protein
MFRTNSGATAGENFCHPRFPALLRITGSPLLDCAADVLGSNATAPKNRSLPVEVGAWPAMVVTEFEPGWGARTVNVATLGIDFTK